MTNDELKIFDEHPDPEDLSVIAEGSGSSWLRNQVLSHITSCEKCSFVLAEVTRGVEEMPDLVLNGSPSPLQIELVEKESIKGSLDNKETEKIKRPWRYPGDTFNFWIAGSFFFLSLLLPSIQVQLLIATAIFGLLAAFDYSHRNIFNPLIDAWRSGDEGKASEAIDRLRDRFKVS
jgi:hypothetical protein